MCMKKLLLITLLVPFAVFAVRDVEELNDGWEFSRDRQTWRSVTLPHDWASGGETAAGEGYYRRTVVYAKAPHGCVFLDLGQVAGEAVVSVDGKTAEAVRKVGAAGLLADITSVLHAGTNAVLVRVDSSKRGEGSVGAGLCGEARLISTDRAYLPKDELFIRVPEIATNRTTVTVEGVFRNRGRSAADGEVTISIRDGEENTVARTVAKVAAEPGADGALKAELRLTDPQPWTPASEPSLYKVRVSYRGKTSTDATTRMLPVRWFRKAVGVETAEVDIGSGTIRYLGHAPADAAEMELFVNGFTEGRRVSGAYEWKGIRTVGGEVVVIAFDAEGRELGRDACDNILVTKAVPAK